ncbi:MAG: hypothetical protein AMXMBFR84_32240 [Candidatus Hydrogenedentota bacterium]
MAPSIYVDGDACPVKNEVYRVAERCGLPVVLVTNMSMWAPEKSWITNVVVDDNPDAADDWIVEHVQPGDIVVTEDIPLAARCLKNGSAAVSTKGRIFTEDSIGNTVAGRDLMTQLRDQGMVTGGPAPFQPKDRSRFLQSLDKLVQASLRGQ